MKKLKSGENVIVEAISNKVIIHCLNKIDESDEFDVSAFLLNSNGKVRSDNDFIFYNQPNTKNNSITLDSRDNENQYFTVNLNNIPQDIQKIAFVITSPVEFALASVLSIEIQNIIIFQPDNENMQEKCLILAELYRHKDTWKFRALGQGFNGGLSPLATGYGVIIEDDNAISPPHSPPVSSSTIQLNKTIIDLKKAGEKATISLSKGKKLTAKLQWDTDADLDLYCFYVDENDKEDKVYYKKLGDLDNAPFIKLLGDSQEAGEEVLEISQPAHIKYVLIAAYSALSNGIGSFYSYKARVTVSDNNQQEITSHLAYKDPFSYWVALALIDFTKSGEITIKNVETYSNKKTFSRQFEERTGEKIPTMFRKSKAKVNNINSYHPERSPYLFRDGTFMMSVGNIEFK